MIPLRDDPIFWHYGMPAQTVRGWMGLGLLMLVHLALIAWHFADESRYRDSWALVEFIMLALVAMACTGVVTGWFFRFRPTRIQLEEWSLTCIEREQVARAMALRAAIVLGIQLLPWLVATCAAGVLQPGSDEDRPMGTAMLMGMWLVCALMTYATVLSALPSRLPTPFLVVRIVPTGLLRFVCLVYFMVGVVAMGENFGGRFNRDYTVLTVLIFIVPPMVVAVADAVHQRGKLAWRLYRGLDQEAWQEEHGAPAPQSDPTTTSQRVWTCLAGLVIALVIPVLLMGGMAGALLYLLTMLLAPVMTCWMPSRQVAPWSGIGPIMLELHRRPAAWLAGFAVVGLTVWIAADQGRNHAELYYSLVALGLPLFALSSLAVMPRRGRRWVMLGAALLAVALCVAVVWDGDMEFRFYDSGLMGLVAMWCCVSVWIGFPFMAHRAERSTVDEWTVESAPMDLQAP